MSNLGNRIDAALERIAKTDYSGSPKSDEDLKTNPEFRFISNCTVAQSAFVVCLLITLVVLIVAYANVWFNLFTK